MKTLVPSPRYLRTSGKFYAYILPGFYEVWRMGKSLYVIIDGVKNSRKFEYTELFKPKPTDIFYAGFHPHDGEPLLKGQFTNE